MIKRATVKEIAEAYRLTPETIRNWVREGLFPSIRLGGKILIVPEDFEQFAERARIKASQNEHTRAILADIFRDRKTA